MVSPRMALAKAVLGALDWLPKQYTSLLVELLNKRYTPSQAQAGDLVEICLRHSADPASAINALTPVTTSDSIIFAINALIASRHPAMDPLFAGVERIESSTIRSVAELWRSEENGTVLESKTLEELPHMLSDVGGRSRRRIDLLLLTAMIKAERLDLVERHLAQAHSIALAELPPAYKIGILRCALKAGPERYLAKRAELRRTLSPLDELRLLELDAASGHGDRVLDHDALLDRLTRLAPEAVQQELNTIVKPRYQQFDTRWMNARIDSAIAESLLDQIAEAVAQKRPLSLIRLSDGEGYAYQHQDEATQEMHWWGVELEPALRAEIQQSVRQAAHQADFLGLPSAFRFLRDVGSFTASLGSTRSTRGLLAILKNVELRKDTRVVEERIHQVLFSRTNLQRLAAVPGSRTLIVSSMQPSIALQLFPEAVCLTVPTHHKTRTNASFAVGEKPLPYTYKDTLLEIRRSAQPGDVVFVAAGIIGKIFVHEARMAGAAALDVGAMADYFMGSKTRSVGDLV